MPELAIRWMRAAGLVVMAVLALAGRPALADDALTFTLAKNLPPLMNTLNLVAQGAGFYREEHLQVTTRFTDQSIQTLGSCASGQSDICPEPIEPLLEHYDDGVRLKMFLTSTDSFHVVIAVPADSPVKTLADLRGKAIGVHVSTGASGVFPTQSALAAVGVKPGETTMVTVGMNQQAMDALASGKVAALGLPTYELVPFIAAGAKLRLLRNPTLGRIANIGYTAAPQVIAAKPDALGRFSRAIVKASLLVRYNPQAAARALQTADGKPLDDATLAAKTAELVAWQEDLPASDPDSKRIGEVSMKGMQEYIDLLADAGAIKAAIPVSEVVTEDYIAYANTFDRKAFKTAAMAAH